MKQDGYFGFDLFTAAPIGAIDAQEVCVALAALDLVGHAGDMCMVLRCRDKRREPTNSRR